MLQDTSILERYRDKIPSLVQWVETPCPEFDTLAAELKEFVQFYDKRNKIPLKRVFPELAQCLEAPIYASFAPASPS